MFVALPLTDIALRQECYVPDHSTTTGYLTPMESERFALDYYKHLIPTGLSPDQNRSNKSKICIAIYFLAFSIAADI